MARTPAVSFVEEYTSNLTGLTWRWYEDASGHRARVCRKGPGRRQKTRAQCRAEASRNLAGRSR